MARFAAGLSLSRVSSVLVISFLVVSTAQAQITDVTNTTSTPIPGTGHDYIKMLNESVSPANGSVSVRIQVPTPPGRRLSLPFAFAYDSNSAVHLGSWNDGAGGIGWLDNTEYLGKGGWSYSVPTLTNLLVNEALAGKSGRCIYDSNFVFQDEAGSRHSLYLSIDVSTASTCSSGTPIVPVQKLTGSDPYYSAALTNVSAPLLVADADGTVYSFPLWGTGGHQGGDNVYSSLVSSVEDRNGNIITVQDLNSQHAGSFSATDTLARTILSTSGFGTSGDTITVSGLSSPYTVTWGAEGGNKAVGSALLYSDVYGCRSIPALGGGTGIKQVTLPDGASYVFSYDPTYGLLNRITYPGGGFVSYTYTLNPLSEFESFDDANGGPNGCYWHHDTPAVAQRSVSFDGVNIALQQTFAYSTAWSSSPQTWNTKTTTVTTTDNVSGLTYTAIYTYAPYAGPRQPNDHSQFQPQIPIESTVVNKNSGGTVQRTVTKTWYNQYELKNQTTALENSQTSQTTYTYGPGAQITERDDYDYGNGAPGALLRQVKTSYQSFPSTPIFPAAASIFDRPCQSIVYDGSANRMTETDYFYDGGSTGTVCGTIGTTSTTEVTGLPSGTHDETNYAATSTNPRGNLTNKTHKCFVGSTNCIDAVSTYTFDKTGQVLSMTDPCGNSTCNDITGSHHTAYYYYTDSYTVLSGGVNTPYAPSANTNAFLTQIKDPLLHTANFTYDFNNAQLTVSKDANGQSDAYLYNDPFSRPTQMNYPDGGQTSLAHNDSTYNQTNNTPNVQITKKIATGLNLTSTTAMDGVRHPARALLTSDPAGTGTADTTYDGAGHERTQSNPHRSASSSTDGTATHNYDLLGRVTSVVEQDGSTATTSYSGNCSTVTDEAGKSRRSCSDGLGRLTQVFEDPSGLNYETDYTYDAMGNLLTVNQKGNDPNSANWRTRTFGYDSLSRLITAANPETGTVCYGTWSGSQCINGYDSNGNMAKKTDARGITITYGYDVLNRLLSKSYSNSDPTVSYTYDAFVSGTNYGTGRRTGMTDASGSSSWTYDTMGRIWSETHVIGGVSKTVSSLYNLDGTAKQVTYPSDSGSVVAYTYDAASHLTQVQDTVHNITYFQTASYFPPGELNQATYGSVVETGIFNNRLQPCWYYATTGAPLATNTGCTGTATAANVLDLKYNFGAGTNDNGNVQGLTNDRDSNRSVSYTYDALNRVASAATPNTDCTVLASGITKNWGEAFTLTPGAI